MLKLNGISDAGIRRLASVVASEFPTPVHFAATVYSTITDFCIEYLAPALFPYYKKLLASIDRSSLTSTMEFEIPSKSELKNNESFGNYIDKIIAEHLSYDAFEKEDISSGVNRIPQNLASCFYQLETEGLLNGKTTEEIESEIQSLISDSLSILTDQLSELNERNNQID